MGVLQQAFGQQPQQPQRSQLFGQQQSQQSPQGSPFMMPGAMQQSQQPEQETSVLGTLLGTAIESATDMATFGIATPDIIPQWQEEQHPYASMVGKIAGSLAGFIPSIAASGGVAGTLRLFPFGAKLIGAARATAGATKMATTMQSAFKMGTTFAIHDVAREYVNQVKTDDPDAYGLGMAAISGMTTGGVFGYVGAATKFAHPVNQILANGTAMAAADAVNMASEGDDPLDHPDTLVQSFLLGAMLSAPNMIGWRKKRVERGRNVVAEADVGIDRMTKGELGTEISRITGLKGKDLKSRLESIRMSKVFELAPVVERGVSKHTVKTPGVTQMHKGAYNQLNKTIREMGIPDEMKAGFISSATGGRTSSLKGRAITHTEGMAIFQNVVDYADDIMTKEIGSIRGAAGLLPEQVKRYGGLATLPQGFRPVFKSLQKLGLADGVEDISKLRRWMDVEKTSVHTKIDALVDGWMLESKEGLGKKIKSVFKNKPTDSTLLLEDLLMTPRGKELSTKLLRVTPRQREIFKELRGTYDFYFKRTNEIRAQMRLEPIEYLEGYHRKLTKRPGYKEEQGATYQKAEKAVLGEQTTLLGEPVNPTSLQRTAKGTAEYTGRDRILKPMKNAIDNDLKEIFLHNPTKLVIERTDSLLKAKVLSKAEAQYTVEFMKHFIYQEPRTSTKEIDASLKGVLKGSGIEGAINGIMDKAGMNRTIGENPASALVGMFGNAVSKGMIAGRPVLAIRNLFQSFYPLAFSNKLAVAKSLLPGMPAELEKKLKLSSIFQISLTSAEEGVGGKGVYGISHVINVKHTAKAAYYTATDNITKGIQGWSDDAGRKLRAANPGKKIFSAGEWTNTMKEVEHQIKASQFLYHITGMPGVFSTLPGKGVFKLQSFPMNYATNYLDEALHRLKTGSPSWSKDGAVKLTNSQRAGIFTHFIGMGVIVGALGAAGLDYSSVVGASVGDKESGGFGIPGTDKAVKLGVFNFRPSPGVNALAGFVNAVSNDEYKRKQGIRELISVIPASTVPYYLAGTGVTRAIEKGDRTGLLLRKQYKPKKKGRTTHGTSPFKSFKSFKSFTGFKGFEGF